MAKICHCIAQPITLLAGTRIHVSFWILLKQVKRSALIVAPITNSSLALRHTGTKARQHPLAIWGVASGYITCAVF